MILRLIMFISINFDTLTICYIFEYIHLCLEMSCLRPCPSDSNWGLNFAKKEDLPLYLIRNEGGNMVYPSINLYGDFISSCKKYIIVEEEGKINPLLISENLENVLKKRINEPNKNFPDDAFQLGQILFEKVSSKNPLIIAYRRIILEP